MMNLEQETIRNFSRGGILINYVQKQALPALVSGLGGALAIWLLAQATNMFALALLIAPFGASCVLLFSLPQSPLAQPRNVIGGHFLSALMGLLVLILFGNSAFACALGVGLAIAVMQFTGTLHPPAGGDPLVVILTGAGWSFLAMPILAGTMTLVAAAWIYHRLISRRNYPV